MKAVYEHIHALEGIPGFSKHEQFVQGMINAINEKILGKGDMLPSVNSLILELGFARETIVRGYRELVRRGIVASRNRMGFYVLNENTTQQLRVLLLLYAFDTFQESFYKSFRSGLGANVYLDVFFHHNNIEIFETIVSNARGKYGMYVVAPIPHPRTAAILQTLPMNHFLMIDRYEPIGRDFSYVTQEFEQSTYKAFAELSDRIRKFDGMVFYYRPASDTPIEILRAFKKFIKDYGIKGVLRSEYVVGKLEKNQVHFTINNIELWAMLKDARQQGLELGKDVGILSHNDDLVKEIICDGITTFSTDFKLMAEKAALFVLTRQMVQEVIPTVLIRRKSI